VVDPRFTRLCVDDADCMVTRTQTLDRLLSRMWWSGFVYGFTCGATFIAICWLLVGTGLI
jgi:uncharacterized membrane protein